MKSQNKEKKVLAFDFGASSGRAILGTFDGIKITIEEIHRFSNEPVLINKIMHWDVLRLFFEIKKSLVKAKKYEKIQSLGIDTWGVDFALLDKYGDLVENPIHYRDRRTNGILESVFKKIDKKKLYHITGNQIMDINTIFQLLSLKEKREYILDRSEVMLLMPDFFNYLLTGIKVSEETIVSTTQCYDAIRKTWAEDVIKTLGIKRSLFTKIVKSGTRVGKISDDICDELKIKTCNVIAVASHDTQSALISASAKEEDFIFLSCGTWSLLGTEIKEPIINKKSEAYNMTNEAAYGNKTSFLKNIVGLWLVQESKRQWERENLSYSFSQLEKMAMEEEAFKAFIDPDDPIFLSPGNLPGRIKEYCKTTGQQIPQKIGEIIRCINESLAMKYRYSIEEIKACTNREYETIYMVGGGVQSKLLCQMTSNACNTKVAAGPIEATVYGNIAVQLISSGDIKDLNEARKIISNSETIKYYLPEDIDNWEKAYINFKKVIK